MDDKMLTDSDTIRQRNHQDKRPYRRFSNSVFARSAEPSGWSAEIDSGPLPAVPIDRKRG